MSGNQDQDRGTKKFPIVQRNILTRKCCLLAELPAKKTQAQERKAKKGKGRSCVGDCGLGGSRIVMEGRENGVDSICPDENTCAIRVGGNINKALKIALNEAE